MNGEGFAFFRWVALCYVKYKYTAPHGQVHGWSCYECRREWNRYNFKQNS